VLHALKVQPGSLRESLLGVTKTDTAPLASVTLVEIVELVCIVIRRQIKQLEVKIQKQINSCTGKWLTPVILGLITEILMKWLRGPDIARGPYIGSPWATCTNLPPPVVFVVPPDPTYPSLGEGLLWASPFVFAFFILWQAWANCF